jgi:hypothetical protein
MKASIISALAAVSGAAVGGFTNAIANWMSNQSQLRAQSFQREINRRQILYRDFIEEAAKCYIDALQRNEADISDLVGLYAKVSRIKILSSAPVVASAESIASTAPALRNRQDRSVARPAQTLMRRRPRPQPRLQLQVRP